MKRTAEQQEVTARMKRSWGSPKYTKMSFKKKRQFLQWLKDADAKVRSYERTSVFHDP